MARHFQAIQKEMSKGRPNTQVINVYLDKEFNTRREWLTMIPAEERCKELLEVYPCFKDHVEVTRFSQNDNTVPVLVKYSNDQIFFILLNAVGKHVKSN